MFNAQLAVLLPMVASAIAICPGFNFGIGNVIRLDSGMNRWNVYNSDCVVVDGLTTTQNPCNSGTFGCTPAPTSAKPTYRCHSWEWAGSTPR
ncbi:hypothetical protein CC2G_004856 [Coprinopsis cinerea AmutBmut pab1-1]|nr:hypothetical protein CC2G_004856 [Coprinopsis cinerea AmutBmut pab1-1]